MASHPLAVVKAAARLTDAVTVGFSGGKDSVATLHLCSLFFPKVTAYFQYMAPGMEFQESYLRRVEARYGFKIVRCPHWVLGGVLNQSVMRPGLADDAEKVPILELADLEAWLRVNHGAKWFATGQKKNDSLERRGMIGGVGGIDFKTRRLYPVADWSNRNIFEYIEHERLLLPESYDDPEMKGSFNIEIPQHLRWLKRKHPEDWKRFVEYYPYAEARVKRLEIYGI